MLLLADFGETAAIPSFREVDPRLSHFTTLFRAPAGDRYDVLLIVGRTLRDHDTWLRKGDVLGLFLQERERRDRVYKIALPVRGVGPCGLKVIRYQTGELTLACRPEYGSGGRNVKLFFNTRSKRLTHQVEYRPFAFRYVVHSGGVPLFIGENGSNFLVIRAAGDNFEVLRGPPADRILQRLPVSYWSEPLGNFRSVDLTRAGDVTFGPESRFSVYTIDNPSWRKIDAGVKERGTRKVRIYRLPQSTCRDFRALRPDRYKLNARCPNEILEEIGPHQVFGGRLWFAKSFYDGEGSGGVGAFGYFDPVERRYRLFSPHEIADWSASALLVEEDAVWIGLMQRHEYGGPAGRVLRWDPRTQRAIVYEAGSCVNRIVRYGGRIYLGTAEGIGILRDGTVENYFVDPTLDGRYLIERASQVSSR